MRYRVRTRFVGDPHQHFGDGGAGQRRDQWVAILIERIHVESRNDISFYKALARVFDSALSGTQKLGALDGRLEILSLSYVDGDGDHVPTQPGQP